MIEDSPAPMGEVKGLEGVKGMVEVVEVSATDVCEGPGGGRLIHSSGGGHNERTQLASEQR